MKSTCALLLVMLLFVSVSVVQNAPAQASARTDVYHVHFAKATLGKGAEEGDFLKQPNPNRPCRDISSYFAIKVAKTGIMPLSSISEPKPRSMLLETRLPLPPAISMLGTRILS